MTVPFGSWFLVLGSWLAMGLESAVPRTKNGEPRTTRTQSSAVVDEATLMVTRKGAPIGRESFRIVRSPGAGGQVYRAVATTALGETKLTTVLATDSLAAPVLYELRVFLRNEQQQFLQGRGRPDRFSVLVQTKRGEAAREYLMRRGTVLLDDEIFYHLYFTTLAALASPDSTVTVISPRETTEKRYRLEWKGVEVVVVGRQNLTGRRFAFIDGAASVRAEVWIDALGRLLKASIPDKSLVALRDDPPR